MINMLSPIQYLFEVSCCLLAFYGFYFFFLKRETFFQFSRVYLLVTPILSLLIPCFQSGKIEFVEEQIPEALDFIPQAIEDFQQTEITIQETINTTNSGFGMTWGDLILWIYGFVVVMLLIRFIYNLWSIFSIIQNNKVERYDDHTSVILDDGSSAFSFFRYLFWNGKKEKNTHLILEHEKVHIRQKHTIDNLVMELLTILFWFHPLIYSFRKAMKMTHEFIADYLVTENFGQRKEYAKLILNNSISQKAILASTFNSFTKNRLAMIYKQRTSSFKQWRMMALLPLIFLLVSLFSFDQINAIPNDPIGNIVSIVENANTPINNNSVTSDDEQGYKYVLQFSEDAFVQLFPQPKDENNAPPIIVMSHKTAKKIMTQQPKLIDYRNKKSFSFELDLKLGKDNFDSNARTILLKNLNDEVQKLDSKEIVFLQIRNLKSSKIEELLATTIAIIPENSNKFTWGRYEFAPNEEIKMPRNEFIQYMTTTPLKSKNALYASDQVRFNQLEKIKFDGKKIQLPLEENYIPRSYDKISREYVAVTSTRVGEKYFFKQICLESPNLPCDYSFSVSIIEDDLSIDFSKTKKSEKFTTQYIVEGKQATKEQYEKVIKENEKAEIIILNMFGKPSLTENEDRMMIVNTKMRDKTKADEFILADEKFHYMLIAVKDGKSKKDEINAAIKKYNKQNYPNNKWRLSTIYSETDGSTLIVVIRRYGNKIEAMNYYKEVVKNKNAFLGNIAFEIFAINQHNYRKVLRTKTLNDYRKYFKENYLK